MGTKCSKGHELRDRTAPLDEWKKHQCDVCKTALVPGSIQKGCWRGACNWDICDSCRSGLIKQEKFIGKFFKSLADSCRTNGAPDRLFIKYLGKDGLVQTAKGSAIRRQSMFLPHKDTTANALRCLENRTCQIPHITDIGAIAFYDNPDGSTKEVLVGSDLSEYPDAPVEQHNGGY